MPEITIHGDFVIDPNYDAICSMEGDYNYYDIDKLLASDEFSDMADRMVLTAEPNYLARFSSSNQVVSYQRRFMNAAKGAQ